MTCIVVFEDKDEIILGGDSAAIDGNSSFSRSEGKIFKKSKNCYMGFAGSFRAGQLAQYAFKMPNQPPKMSDHEFLCTHFIKNLKAAFKKNDFVPDDDDNSVSFIVVYNSTIYEIDCDFQVGIPIQKYYAIGSGAEYAMGSLHTSHNLLGVKPTTKVQAALEAASAFCTGVKPPFKLIKIEK